VFTEWNEWDFYQNEKCVWNPPTTYLLHKIEFETLTPYCTTHTKHTLQSYKTDSHGHKELHMEGYTDL